MIKARTIDETMLNEGYGAGFSMSSGGRFSGGMGGTTRGGFGGSWNSGGPNQMYTYEIKPLNHVLEPKPSETFDQIEQLHIGSKVTGRPIKSNAIKYDKKISGIVQSIKTADDGAIKYYVVFDEATATPVRVDPTTVKLIVEDPVKYFADTTSDTPSQRRIKMERAAKNRKLVSESFTEFLNKHKQ